MTVSDVAATSSPKGALPLRERLLMGFLSGLAASIRRLPKALVPSLASCLGALAWTFAKKDKRLLRRNVAEVLKLPAGTEFARLFERQVVRHQAQCALETVRGILDPNSLLVEGYDEMAKLIQNAEAGGKGHIVITAHLGAWELCALYPGRAASRPFHVLAKPSRSPALTRFLDRLRSRMGVMVLWTDRKTLLRDMLGALRRGESVGFVMDQKPEGRKGPVVPFFGRDTEFVSGPAAMAIKTGCPVVAVFCLREGPFRYRLLAREILPPGHDEKDEIALTARMAAEIERAIRLYPEQWTWNYKRWR